MTNANRIRHMSDEELAMFIFSVKCNTKFGDCNKENGSFCPSCNGEYCYGVFSRDPDPDILKWLREE